LILDFVGQPILPGCYVAQSGRGNTTSEYGMILYKVIGVEPEGKIKVVRLKIRYSGNTTSIRTYKTTLRSRKVCVITPIAKTKDLFERALNGSLSPEEIRGAVSWLHRGTPL